MTTLLECHQLNIQVDKRSLVNTLDLSIQSQQCWAILGPNGVGKTQLLRHLSGLNKISHAENIQLQGKPLSEYSVRQRAQRIGLVAQHSSTGFQHTALDMVLSGHYPHQASHLWDSQQAIDNAYQALVAVGMEAHAEQPLEQLSGGELRRVEIARLLIQNPQIALLDEPLNHLDINQQMHILRLLKARFVNNTQALVMVLHDLNLARQIASHCLLLFTDGSWLAGPTHEVANRKNLSKLINHPLIEYAVDESHFLIPEQSFKPA